VRGNFGYTSLHLFSLRTAALKKQSNWKGLELIANNVNKKAIPTSVEMAQAFEIN